MTNYPAGGPERWADIGAAKAHCVCCRGTIDASDVAVSQISGVIFAHDRCLTTLTRGAGEEPRRLMTLGSALRR